jgi:hypothetical protein
MNTVVVVQFMDTWNVMDLIGEKLVLALTRDGVLTGVEDHQLHLDGLACV